MTQARKINGFSHLEEGIEIPLALARKQWLQFLRVAACGTPQTVTPIFRLGTFEMTVRRLCDLGVMKNPRKKQYKGHPCWDADWKAPKTLAEFQASPMVQYQLFVKSIKGFFGSPEVAKAIGQIIDGKPITQSGALMLAHRAGLNGMKSWIAESSVREQFSNNTTSFFLKANGIF
jgi:hypothetical protein